MTKNATEKEKIFLSGTHSEPRSCLIDEGPSSQARVAQFPGTQVPTANDMPDELRCFGNEWLDMLGTSIRNWP